MTERQSIYKHQYIYTHRKVLCHILKSLTYSISNLNITPATFKSFAATGVIKYR